MRVWGAVSPDWGVWGRRGCARACVERRWVEARDEAGEGSWVCLVPKLSRKGYASEGRGPIEPRSWDGVLGGAGFGPRCVTAGTTSVGARVCERRLAGCAPRCGPGLALWWRASCGRLVAPGWLGLGVASFLPPPTLPAFLLAPDAPPACPALQGREQLELLRHSGEIRRGL